MPRDATPRIPVEAPVEAPDIMEQKSRSALLRFLTLRIVNMIKWMLFYSSKFWEWFAK